MNECHTTAYNIRIDKRCEAREQASGAKSSQDEVQLLNTAPSPSGEGVLGDLIRPFLVRHLKSTGATHGGGCMFQNPAPVNIAKRHNARVLALSTAVRD